METYRRHDLSDTHWNTLEPHQPGGDGQVGRPATDNRRFLDAVFWILRTSAPWRDKRTLGKSLEIVIDEPNCERLTIGATHCKVHPHAAGAKGGNQDMGRTKGGLTPRYIWPWMRLVYRSESLLQRVPSLITHNLAD